MRIAIFQTAGVSGVIEPNLEQLAEKADEAAKRHVRLLVCPEMYLTGYNVETEVMARLAEASDGPSARRTADIARRKNLAILYGYAERSGDAVYNAAQLVDSAGRRLANCRKSHLFGSVDRRTFTPGESLAHAELDGVSAGILICYDVEFPESVRSLALAGAAVVLVPTALMKPHEFVANALVPVRAWENQLFVVYANRCGTEGELDYAGLSTVAGPRGEIIAQAGESESLLIADLDFRARERARRYFNYLDDRRPDLYRNEN